MIEPQHVLDYWLGDSTRRPEDAQLQKKKWYSGGAALDEEIKARFRATLNLAERGQLNRWREAPTSALALIILLDQFSRHIYRGTAEAFQNDSAALEVALGLDRHHDLNLMQRVFAYHPLKHSEDLQIQSESLLRFNRLVEEAPATWTPLIKDFYRNASRHHELIVQFGRFPHRNALLGRTNTEAETVYLNQTRRRFGQHKKLSQPGKHNEYPRLK